MSRLVLLPAVAVLFTACAAEPGSPASVPEIPDTTPLGTQPLSGSQRRALETLNRKAARPFRAVVPRASGNVGWLSGLHAEPTLGTGDVGTAARRFVTSNRGLFDLPGDAQLERRRVRTDGTGRTHVTLALSLAGVPVEGGELGVHFDPDGRVEAVGGMTVPADRIPVLEPTVSRRRAIREAETRLAHRYPGARAEDLAATLVVLPRRGEWYLTWRVGTRLEGRLETPTWYLDAHTSDLRHFHDGLRAHLGSGLGVRGARRRFDVTPRGTAYGLQSTASHPAGILTLVPAGQQAAVLLSEDPNDWSTPGPASGSAVDAHVFQHWIYRYYRDVHGRDAFDGEGSPHVALVHYGDRLANAFWSAEARMVAFGDGDGTVMGPTAGALDIVAHEMTHGVTDASTGLVYADQPGALDEAASDVMAVFIEHWAARGEGRDRDANWQLGEEAMLGTLPLRDLAKPTRTGKPDHMDDFLHTRADFGGVHTNSTIVGHAVYLYSVGGTHRTSGIEVRGIGLRRAERVFYHALEHCFTASTDFIQAAECQVKAAEVLFGEGSCEALEVRNAFLATGILEGEPASCGGCLPACDDVACGADDGCGGTCGEGSGCEPACSRTCDGVACGEQNGCGEVCAIGSGCSPVCDWACEGVLCGADDGCGGTCQPHFGCCEPLCEGVVCGAGDGCGGTCDAGSGCCEPRCEGLVCGERDGCGGVCEAGSGCCEPSCEGRACGESDGCGGTCAAGRADAPGCCERRCTGRTCGGADGCGGICGAGSGCCTPSCSGRPCGASDACGGECAAGDGCVGWDEELGYGSHRNFEDAFTLEHGVATRGRAGYDRTHFRFVDDGGVPDTGRAIRVRWTVEGACALELVASTTREGYPTHSLGTMLTTSTRTYRLPSGYRHVFARRDGTLCRTHVLRWDYADEPLDESEPTEPEPTEPETAEPLPEPNDGADAASPAQPGITYRGRAGSGDEDWAAFGLSAEDRFRVTLQVRSEPGSCRLHVVRTDGTTAGYYGSSRSTLAIEDEARGPVKVRVRRSFSAEHCDYDLSLVLVDPAPTFGVDPEREGEPNGSADAATAARVGVPILGTAESWRDDDWFAFDGFAEGEPFRVVLFVGGADRPVCDLEVRGEDGRYIGGSFAGDETRIVSGEATGPLRVKVDGVTPCDYRLEAHRLR